MYLIHQYLRIIQTVGCIILAEERCMYKITEWNRSSRTGIHPKCKFTKAISTCVGESNCDIFKKNKENIAKQIKNG